jgi:MscS family membrane protein
MREQPSVVESMLDQLDITRDLPTSFGARWMIAWLEEQGLHGLLERGPFDIQWWQWIALLVAAAAAWILGRLLGSLTRTVLRRVSMRTTTVWDDRLIASIGPPIGVAWLLVLFALFIHLIGLPGPAISGMRQTLRWLSVATILWALWRSVTVILGLLLLSPWAVGHPSARNLVAVGGNLAKGVIAVLGILALLGALGYPVTTLLAGLGIGGLAFAFGAQKTVENLFGSMAIAVDQPFRVGDAVRVADFTGTVEDIGLRSTRFRTPDRTIISIPNGSLADQRLESLAERDRIRLAATISLAYGTTRAQVQQVLGGFEKVLRAHPRTANDVVVAFSQLGPNSLDIEVAAGFLVPAEEFNQCRQDVLLEFMRVVEEAGTTFAVPTRAVHLTGAAAEVTAPRG